MTIDEAIRAAGREWRRLGVPSGDRRALASDLRLDLEAARADGVPAERLIEGDVRDFARRLAVEAGVRHVPPRYGRIVATALAGALVGAVAGVVFVAGVYMIVTQLLGRPGDFGLPLVVAACVYYGGVGLVSFGGALVGVLVVLRRVPAIGRTAAAMTALTPLAAVVMVPLLMLFAWSTGYRTSAAVVLAEVALAVAAFGAAVVLARRWSLARV